MPAHLCRHNCVAPMALNDKMKTTGALVKSIGVRPVSTGILNIIFSTGYIQVNFIQVYTEYILNIYLL